MDFRCQGTASQKWQKGAAGDERALTTGSPDAPEARRPLVVGVLSGAIVRS
jgi:hypothetical protein